MGHASTYTETYIYIYIYRHTESSQHCANLVPQPFLPRSLGCQRNRALAGPLADRYRPWASAAKTKSSEMRTCRRRLARNAPPAPAESIASASRRRTSPCQPCRHPTSTQTATPPTTRNDLLVGCARRRSTRSPKSFFIFPSITHVGWPTVVGAACTSPTATSRPRSSTP